MSVRHPLAAVLAVAGIAVGMVAAVGGSAASAAGDELVGTSVFTCTSEAAPTKPYDWNGTLTLTAVRPAADSTAVTVVAKLSKMAGTVPLDVGMAPITEVLDLNLAGASVKLNGSGTTEIKALTEIALPDVQGTLTSAAPELAVTVKSFDFSVTAMGATLATNCVVKSGGALGDLKVTVGAAPPTPTPTPVAPTPTTTTKATATPTPSSSATGKTTNSGKAAKGKAVFACTLSIGSKFDYNADISVSGSRVKAGDDVSLLATMSDLPGIAPVPIDGSMDYTLDATVGGKAVTLSSTADVYAGPKEEVAVADLFGAVSADGDEMEVAVTKFTFDFPSAGIGAKCTTKSVVIGTMAVGSEAIVPDSSDSPSSIGTTTSGDTLPKTGGADSMPVVALWALALTLLGVAGLLCVPRTRRQH